ncbi:hypothetical protein CPB97_003122 [Podila verticillata]|nr:hypothetical protein CPB97_003122 [Podila verticillata]
MKERQELLQRYIQSSANPYMIDCNLQSNWPVQRAKTYNVVYDILKTATSQAPLALKPPLIKKTPKMVSIDTNLNWQARVAFQPIQKDIIQNNRDLSAIRSKVSRLYAEYKNMDQVVNGTKHKEDVATRDDMEVVFEDEYLASAEPYPRIYSRTMTFDKQPRTIEKVHTVSENIEIEKILGGEGSNFCSVVYRRKTPEAASLVVRLYSKKLDIDGSQVGETENMAVIRNQRTAAIETLRRAEARSRALTKLQTEYNLLRFVIFREHIPWTVMELLTLEEVYEMRETPYDTIRDIYLKSESAFGSDPYASNLVATATDHQGYSILVFGKTQAGKSTFIEFVKNYANQQYDIDDTLLGTGFKSTTGYPIRHVVTSNLPTYSVVDKTGALMDIDTLGETSKDHEDYLDALNDRKARLIPAPQDPDALPPAQIKITFLDTPGIEDTNGRDTEHAPKIIDEMAKLRTLNLIVVIVNCEEPPSKSHQLAFDYYSKVIQVLQGCHSNIVFVYTHVDYVHCHRSNVQHKANLDMRHKAFSRLFRGMGHMQGQGSFNRDEIRDEQVELYPWYTVDLKKNHRPIPRCMLFNTLREILQRAVTSPPVPLDTIMKNLIRVYGISHPDELNQLQRRKIMTPMGAILDERPPEFDTTSATSGENGRDEDGYLSDHFCERVDEFEEEAHSVENEGGSEADYADYFDKDDCRKKIFVRSNLPKYEVYRRDSGEVVNLHDSPDKVEDEEEDPLADNGFKKEGRTFEEVFTQNNNQCLQRAEFEKQLVVANRWIASMRHLHMEHHLLRTWNSRTTLPMAVMEERTKAEVCGAKETPFDKIKEIYLKLGEVYDWEPREPQKNKPHQKGHSEMLEDKKACSVLISGKKQAGQVEFYRSVDTSNLLAYKVFDNSGIPIDIGSLGDKYQDPDDYLDTLNDRETTLQPTPRDITASLSRHVIAFLDTPGIEDTNGRDIEHAPKIIEAMAKKRYFTLITVVINSKETPSPTLQLGHHSNVVFLYTHVEYDRCHHSNTDHFFVMVLRHNAFSQLFRCQGSYKREEVSKAAAESYSMYNIDFDKRQRPITRCMKLMTS